MEAMSVCPMDVASYMKNSNRIGFVFFATRIQKQKDQSRQRNQTTQQKLINGTSRQNRNKGSKEKDNIRQKHIKSTDRI